MTWVTTNKSSLALWINLKASGQIAENKSFTATKNLKMKQLAFWGRSSSTAVIEVRAHAFIIWIDAVNKSWWGSKFERGYRTSKAIEEMKNLLVEDSGSKTCEDLAILMDKIYKFIDE